MLPDETFESSSKQREEVFSRNMSDHRRSLEKSGGGDAYFPSHARISFRLAGKIGVKNVMTPTSGRSD